MIFDIFGLTNKILNAGADQRHQIYSFYLRSHSIWEKNKNGSGGLSEATDDTRIILIKYLRIGAILKVPSI